MRIAGSTTSRNGFAPGSDGTGSFEISNASVASARSSGRVFIRLHPAIAGPRAQARTARGWAERLRVWSSDLAGQAEVVELAAGERRGERLGRAVDFHGTGRRGAGAGAEGD